MEYKEIVLINYRHPDTNEVVGVDIVGMVKASSYVIAGVKDSNKAMDWARNQSAPIRFVEDDVPMDGDTPIFKPFESDLFKVAVQKHLELKSLGIATNPPINHMNKNKKKRMIIMSENNKYIVEVKSELTGKSVISFESTNRQEARKEGYQRIADFLGINRAVASLNYFIEVN